MKFTRYLAGLAALSSLIATPAFATLITFDDLPAEYERTPGTYDPGLDPARVIRPLTDQYLSQGVSFGNENLDDIVNDQSSYSGAGLTTQEEVVVSGPNAVSSIFTHDGLRFEFVGDELPDYLSFYASAPTGAMTVYVYEADGTVQEMPLGWSVDSGEFEYTDTPMKQKVEFFADGIKSVWLSNFYGHRTTPVFMDDLYFTSGQPVTGPAAFPLLMSGMLGLGLMGWRRRLKTPGQA